MMISLAMAAALLDVRGAVSHPASGTAVVYFTIRNNGPEDQLVGVATTVARSATIHKSMAMKAMHDMPGMQNEMMVAVASVDVPAHGALIFSSGGYHVMLDGLRHPLKAGMRFVVRLHFVHAGWIDVPVRVESY